MAARMRVLVAGGAGFIGSHLCDRLLADGHRVIAVDSLVTGRMGNIAHLRRERRFRFVRRDITAPLVLAGRIDWIFNLASPASPVDFPRIPVQILLTGSVGSRTLLELARRKRARYLLASTSEVYGDPLVHPQPESYWGNVNPIGPRGCYDEAKRFAEAIAMAYRRARGVDTRIVRIFNTYGPRMRLNDGRVVPALVDQALHGRPLTVFGDGSQTRSFCYVSDLVDGICRLMRSNQQDPVNIGNPHEMTILAFANTIRRLTGTRSRIAFKPLPVDDPKQRRPDIARARRTLGWEPRIGFEQGIRQTIDWFAAHRGRTRR
ncbi:MAG TPA: UDP-glucuronic acid decarboxylase family protein [Candidatus Edwardsbacteria bacterium]|nr:UDP-glucuronic acid decarboxylase family protein [Candidatus Edwardsbacteria bacterium]